MRERQKVTIDGIDAERFDADYLSEKGNERDDKREHEYISYRRLARLDRRN